MINDACWEQTLKLFRQAIICPMCHAKDIDYIGGVIDGEIVHFRCNTCRHSYYPAKMTLAERMAVHIRLWSVQTVCGDCKGDNPPCPIFKVIKVEQHGLA